jgi:transposase
MRHELSDYEWTAIKPMLPNKPRGVRRVNHQLVFCFDAFSSPKPGIRPGSSPGQAFARNRSG